MYDGTVPCCDFSPECILASSLLNSSSSRSPSMSSQVSNTVHECIPGSSVLSWDSAISGITPEIVDLANSVLALSSSSFMRLNFADHRRLTGLTSFPCFERCLHRSGNPFSINLQDFLLSQNSLQTRGLISGEPIVLTGNSWRSILTRVIRVSLGLWLK